MKKVTHPHSYRFPYIVEETNPKVYRIYYIGFTGDHSPDELKNYVIIGESSPEENGFIKDSVKKNILEVVSSWSKNKDKKLCVVFGPKECVYCDADGTKEDSKEVPSGGFDAFKTFAKIPAIKKGLEQCSECGYFHGTQVINERGVKVDCCCNPQICNRCKKPVYKWKIGSKVYHPEQGEALNIPVFCAWGHRCPDGVRGQQKNSFIIDPGKVKGDL